MSTSASVPPSSDPQTRSPLPSSPTVRLDEVRPLYPSLRQALSTLDLDVIQELDRFREWSRAHSQQGLTSFLPLPHPRRSSSDTNGHSPAPQGSVDVTQPLPRLPHVNQRGSEGSEPQSRSTYRRGMAVDYPPYLKPQDVVEDLDLEEKPRSGGALSPFLILLVWLASCGGIGVGIWWLLSPGDPHQVQVAATPSEPEPTPTPLVIDLSKVPLIPVPPSEIAQAEEDLNPLTRRRSLRRRLNPNGDLDGVEIARLDTGNNWLDFLGLDLSSLESSLDEDLEAEAEDQENPDDEEDDDLETEPTPEPEATVAVQPTPPPPTPAAPPPPATVAQADVGVDSLGPNRGEGTFLVLMTYQGDSTLEQAREVSDGAFVKDIAGQKYIQLASFQQLEYARYMADNLRQQGIAITITEKP